MGTDEQIARLERQLADQRRRHERDLARTADEGVLRGAEAAIAVIDGLDRALADLGAGARAYAAGFEMLRTGAIAELAQLGLETIWPLEDDFDPHHHEAVGHRPGSPEGRVVQVVRRGWAAGHGLVRAAQVIVALPGVPESEQVTCPHGRRDASQCMACFRERSGWGSEDVSERRRRRPQ